MKKANINNKDSPVTYSLHLMRVEKKICNKVFSDVTRTFSKCYAW